MRPRSDLTPKRRGEFRTDSDREGCHWISILDLRQSGGEVEASASRSHRLYRHSGLLSRRMASPAQDKYDLIFARLRENLSHCARNDSAHVPCSRPQNSLPVGPLFPPLPSSTTYPPTILPIFSFSRSLGACVNRDSTDQINTLLPF